MFVMTYDEQRSHSDRNLSSNKYKRSTQASNLVPNWRNQIRKVKSNTDKAPKLGLEHERNTLAWGDAGDDLQSHASSWASHITYTSSEINMMGDLEYGGEFDHDEAQENIKLARVNKNKNKKGRTDQEMGESVSGRGRTTDQVIFNALQSCLYTMMVFLFR